MQGTMGLRSIQQHLGPDYFRVRIGSWASRRQGQGCILRLKQFPKK